VGQKQRVDALERKTGRKDGPVVVVWRNEDGSVTLEGETLTEDEWRARFPDAVTVEWDEGTTLY